MMPTRAGLFMKTFNKTGFTLVELMIVLAIVAILSAIALLNFQTYTASRRLNGAAREVYGHLMAIRTQAISENKWIALNIDSNHQYTMFRDNNKNGTVDTGESITIKDLHPTYHDVTFSTSLGTVIVFYPNGTGSTGTLGLTGSTGSKSITISNAGRIKIN
jgi:type IV fimbrial biogenesis protein FimU